MTLYFLTKCFSIYDTLFFYKMSFFYPYYFSVTAPLSECRLSSDMLSSMDRRVQLLDEYLQRNPCIIRAQYARLTGRSYKQAVNDLNQFIRDGVLVRYGMGRNVVYAGKK